MGRCFRLKRIFQGYLIYFHHKIKGMRLQIILNLQFNQNPFAFLKKNEKETVKI